MFFVYVLQSELTGQYYIGSTKDMKQRLTRHNAGTMQASRALRPWRLIYTEAFETLSEARKREAKIKSWKNRAYMRNVLGLQ